MGMLGDDALGVVPGARMPHPPRHVAGHLSAMRAAFAGMSSGRLPPHLLFSDRDFNEDDYEALLALDDTVENRKGRFETCVCLCVCVMSKLFWGFTMYHVAVRSPTVADFMSCGKYLYRFGVVSTGDHTQINCI